ncbi:SDR family oxidoreductase [Caulobacter sp. UNC279MFTsu5.1]|uniref:SDR family oxidoreductase n=1 Tax=Caulobacter sp. UNC279MFTsu5.1 TaxID=1502775 RepID=UPI0008DECB4F|nr:SDR family oxidoreductase [Caulobacter sp. UNC279MFTsu5.1]SFK11445.1 Nucleoside-diphosphate-sugar epimerase [Caulobacter sp. UNC279MFTsu5.1]
MRILVLGAYGLIGGYVCARLLAEDHAVIGVGRDIAAARRRFPAVDWRAADLRIATVADWAAMLQGVDAVVNCAGALQDSPRDNLKAVHIDGVARLVEACGKAGVTRFVHVSAAGVGSGRPTVFNTTKQAAEALLRASALDWTILRPGLVLAPAAYGGTALLRGLAGFPLVVPIAYPDSLIHTTSAEDVAIAVQRAVALGARRRISVDLVHAKAVTLAELVTTLRGWLGLPPARVVAVPPILARMTAAAVDALAWLGWRSPMRTASLEQLRAGVPGDADQAQRLLGFAPRSLRAMLDGWPSGVQERWFSKSYFLKPTILFTLFGFWFLSGLIGLTAGFDQAVSVLTTAGVGLGPAKAAVIGGGVADIALALLLAFRRTAGAALLGMLALTAGYLVGGALVRPDLWLDPLGPFLKSVPAAVLALAALALLDER